MVVASLLFAGMGVCVKFASEHFNSAELVCYRGVLGVAILWALARARRVSLATRHPGMHAWRSLIGVVSLGAWFYSIAALPIATAMTLNYMSSVWIAVFLLGGALLAWRPAAGARPVLQGPLVLTVLAGFAGVVMMLRPTIGHDQVYAGLLGLLSGIAAAFAYMQVMVLSRMGEPDARTVFYFAVGSAVAGGAAMLVTGTSPWSWEGAIWLVPMGVLASMAQLCMTRAYAGATSRRGTLVVANLQYSGIVFSGLFSFILFDERIPLLGWAGMALIVTSGIGATVLRTRATPASPAQEH